MNKIRIKFQKYGPIRYIGHLDVMRFFQKAIRRAGIDVSYTSGFSPHQIMSFASPLGVGMESRGEYMDIQVNSLPAPREGKSVCDVLVEDLRRVCVEGLEPVSARILPDTAKNAMASVAAASYTVRFREGREPGGFCALPEAGRQDKIRAFTGQERIPFVRETKKGAREIDLRPGIFSLVWKDRAFEMLLDASSAGNRKPGHVAAAFFDFLGEPLGENALWITREDLFARGEDGIMGELISLGEMGSADPETEVLHEP